MMPLPLLQYRVSEECFDPRSTLRRVAPAPPTETCADFAFESFAE